MSVLFAVSLAACHKDPEPDSGTEPLAGTLVELAEERGFTVGTGALLRVDDRDCCEPGAGCWFSNPDAPYLATALPPAPGQTVPDIGVSGGLSPNYHLGADEAVVLLGQTPPEVAYYGSSSFVGYRFVSGQITAPRGATGPSINSAAIALPPGSPYAVVTTMDADLERDVASWLEAGGLDAGSIFFDRIPPELVREGFEPQSDTFAHVLRLAGFADPDAGAAYLADPGARLYRLTPDAHTSPGSPHPLAPMPPRGSGTNELAWVVAVGKLGDAIRARFSDRPSLEVQIQPQAVEPYACIDQGYCSFDSSDRYYARTVLGFSLAQDEWVVAFGPNHTRTGHASHTSLAVHEIEHTLEITSFDDDAMVGSARAYLDDPLVDDLYAVTFARDCSALPAPCFEIGGGCPGAEPEESMLLALRAYLDPSTGTGPQPSELVIDRAIKVFSPFPIDTDTGTTATTPTDTGTSSSSSTSGARSAHP